MINKLKDKKQKTKDQKHRNSIYTSGSFQKDLEQSIVKTLFILVGISCILFVTGMYITRIISNQINAYKHLELLENTYKEVYQDCLDYLTSEKTKQHCKNIVSQKSNPSDFTYSFYQFNADSPIKSNIMITSSDGSLYTTTFNKEELNLHLINFNEFVCQNAKKQNDNEIYQAVYYMTGTETSYVLCYPLYDNKELLCFVNLYIGSSGWDKLFAEYQFDAIITDDMANVIYSSRQSLIKRINKFQVEKNASPIYFNNNERYWMLSKELRPYNIRIYSLVYYPKSSFFVGVGILIMMVLGICMLKFAKEISKDIAKKKSASINALVREIKIIRKGDHEHRIHLDTEDEITDVGYEINRMLDNLKKLNEKNTELIRINNLIEIKQLTEQMNPHFLYNTLETIRYLVGIDAKQAQDLIVRLTQILRYSINSAKRDVTLQEDMEYIKAYLAIQKSRFADRFQYSIQIDNECYNCVIPKLLLQPIIENSIKYGFKKKMEIEIRITGLIRSGTLILSVWDNGVGMSKKEMEELQRFVEQDKITTEHNGLHNIARRLYLQYGTDSGIRFSQNEAGGLTVTLSISQKGGSHVQSINR